MTPVFLNSAYVKAPERFVLSGGAWAQISLKVRYGFFEHPRVGPVLIDAGYGPRVTKGDARSLALRAYTGALKPTLVDAQLPLNFLSARGIRPHDVRSVIVTHFHADHVAALRDFPNATFYANGNAWKNIQSASAFQNVRHGIFRELMPDDFAARLTSFEQCALNKLPDGLGQGYDIFGDGLVYAVPLPGHASGHHGIFFAQIEQPLLYATDTQWLRRAVVEERVPGFPAVLVSDNQTEMLASVKRVRNYHHAGGQFVLCHDPEDAPYDFRASPS